MRKKLKKEKMENADFESVTLTEAETCTLIRERQKYIHPTQDNTERGTIFTQREVNIYCK